VTPRTLTTRSLPAILVLAGTLLLAAGCGHDQEAAQRAAKDVKAKTATARVATVATTVTAPGSVAGENRVQVSTRMMGWIREVLVREGAQVKVGQALVRIDDVDLQARRSQAQAGIAEAEAVLANAETNLARFESLYAQKSVSKAQLDEVRTGRDRARAGVDGARAGLRDVDVQLGYLAIKAPISGTVVRRLVDAGNMASPGQPLLEIEQVGTMKVTAGVSERDVNLVAAGDTVTVEVASVSDAVFRVAVARIVPAASAMSRTFDLEAYLPNPDGRLKSGMFARVHVPVGQRQAVLAPAAALFARGQLTGVWLVDDQGLARLRWVRAGRAQGDEVEVISGLAGGETVVLTAEQPLEEGDRVVK
jgi:RND family efflux transporter MFP subunit